MNPVSPKVISGANWAGYATILLTLLNSISPEMLTALGKWEPLVNGLIVGVSYGLGAYLKEDPLRTAAAPAPVAPATTNVILIKPVTPLPTAEAVEPVSPTQPVA